jgi:hypothetical protein
MSTTGKSWKIARYSGTTPYNIGGIPSAPKFVKHAANELEKGTGQRRLILLQATNIYWELSFRMKLQNLDYIITYAMPSAEADLPLHNLWFTDGISSRGFTNVLIDKCDLEIKQTGSIIANITAFAITNESKTLTVTYDTDAPMTKSAVQTITVGGNALTKWTDLSFGVANNATREATGTTDIITELYARDPNYNGRFKFVKLIEPMYGFDATLKQSIVLSLKDNRTSPITKVFTFANAALKQNPVEVQELDLTYETIDWVGDRLVIS